MTEVLPGGNGRETVCPGLCGRGPKTYPAGDAFRRPGEQGNCPFSVWARHPGAGRWLG